MKHLKPGDGYDPIIGQKTNYTALELPNKEIEPFYEEKFRSKTQLIENTDKLHKQLSILLGLSGNINNIAPGIEASFSKDLTINQFHAYFVIVLDVEKCTKEVDLKDLKIADDARKLLVNNVAGFNKKYGNSFVQSVIYGKKFVAVVQIKDFEKINELKRKFDGKTETQYAKVHLQIESAIEAIKQLSNANVYIYSAGSDTDAQAPQTKLNAEVEDLNKLLGQLRHKKKDDTTATAEDKNNKSTSSDSNAKNTKSSDTSGDQAARSDSNKTSPKSIASKVVDRISSAVNSKDNPSTGSKADTKTEVTAENIKLNLTLSLGGKDEQSQPTDKKATDKKDEKENEKYVPLRYDTKKYSEIAEFYNLDILDIQISNANNLLKYITKCHRRVAAYINSIDYAFSNAHLLSSTAATLKNLEVKKAELEDIKTSLKSLAELISENVIEFNKDLYNKCYADINTIVSRLNNFNAKLIKFDESAFLLGSIKSKKSDLNLESVLKLRLHRSSHHTLALAPPEDTKKLLLIAKTASGAAAPEELTYNIRKNNYIFFSKQISHKLRNVTYLDLPDPGTKSLNDYLKSVYIADPKHAGGEFFVDVYAIVGPKYKPIAMNSRYIFKNIDSVQIAGAKKDQENELSKTQPKYSAKDNRYRDDEISKLIDLKISKISGYVKNCDYLVANKGDGSFSDEDTNHYFVAVTPAIDSAGEKFVKTYNVNSSSSVSSINLAFFLDKSSRKEVIEIIIDNMLLMLKDKSIDDVKAYVKNMQNLLENRLETIVELLDSHSVAVDLQKALVKKRTEIESSRKDVFDELKDKLLNGKECFAKILFPYNLSDTHWLVSEIKIHRIDNKYDIQIFAHDPYGGGEIEKSAYDIISSAIIKRLNEIHSQESKLAINIKSMKSPYNRRQSSGDVTSCGVIVVEDLIKRLNGESLSVDKPYPIGANELRNAQLKLIQQELRLDDAVRINFLNHHQILDTAPISAVRPSGNTSPPAHTLAAHSLFAPTVSAVRSDPRKQIEQAANQLSKAPFRHMAQQSPMQRNITPPADIIATSTQSDPIGGKFKVTRKLSL